MKTIAIVGAGFCGTVTAMNLLRHSGAVARTFRVVLIGNADSFGMGLAYSTEDDNLVLNVPIGNMSAFTEKPDDFLDFCNRMDSALISGSFVCRRIYGEYLRTRLKECRIENADRLVERRDRVTGILQEGAGYALALASGERETADYVVLALGHSPPRKLMALFGEGTAGGELDPKAFLDDPWDIRSLDGLPLDKDALIVGTGHTAIDTLFRLVSCPSPRKIYLVSRHGHLPHGHRNAGEFVKLAGLSTEVEMRIKGVLEKTPTVRAIFSAIRQLASQHVARHGNWRDVINSLRHITPEIWARLPISERGRFLRHLVHHWDVLRHRLAPVPLRRLDELVSSGRVQIIAGRIVQLQRVTRKRELTATIKIRGSDASRTVAVGSVINCSGPNYDLRTTEDSLLRGLADNAILFQDDLRLGFAVDENYRCSGSSNLYYVGPMLKARYWEAIAVPELRTHTLNLVKILVSALQTSASPLLELPERDLRAYASDRE